MKECPVCKESFQDDLNFCDLDGSPLDGGAATTVAGGSSKLWSFLGIALLVAAVGISAGAIIFFPRGPSNSLPTGRSQTPTGIAAGQPTSMAPDGGRNQVDASAANLDRSPAGPSDAAAAGSPDPARLASRKAALSKNGNSDSSLPNPKSVAASDEDLTGAPKPPVDESRPRTSKPSSSVDPASAAKAASTDSSGSDSASKSSAAASTKRRSKAQAQGDDADPTGSKKDEKKKGGFLRVFKKIFGHG
jgi:hypothetical protein